MAGSGPFVIKVVGRHQRTKPQNIQILIQGGRGSRSGEITEVDSCYEEENF